MTWVSRAVLVLAMAAALAACGTQDSRAIDDGTRQIKELYAQTLKEAKGMIANHPASYAGPHFNPGEAFREVLAYSVDGDTVTWLFYFYRTGTDPDSFSNYTVQVGTCIEFTGTSTSMNTTTVPCPVAEIRERRLPHGVEVDILD